MAAIVHYLLLQWGITWVIAASSIVSPLRVLLLRHSSFVAHGLYCFGCIGFWVGILQWLCRGYPWPSGPDYWHGLEAGLIGTATSLLLLLVTSNERLLELEMQRAFAARMARAAAVHGVGSIRGEQDTDA